MTTSISFPRGFDPSRLLEPMMSAAVESSSAYRRAITETDAVRFALIYLSHHLSSADTNGEISLSEFHLSMARSARRWMRAEPRRDIWIAPRRSGKSSWQHLILPLWAVSHGHRNTFMSFSHSNTQAQRHMANLRRELAENDLLLSDFPELRPMRGGNGSSNSASTVTTRGGRVFATGGMDTGALGTKFGSERIGILCCHEVGTQMMHGRNWIPVESHPSFRGERVGPGRRVAVWGLPFTETVTADHRYWAKWINGKRGTSRPPDWVEAVDLTPHHRIGTPIDMTVEPCPGWIERVRARRGRGYVDEVIRPSRFDDPEFWWMVGYWWGNGHVGCPVDGTSGNHATVAVTIPHKHPEYAERLVAHLTAKWWTVPPSHGGACTSYYWTDSALARWLRTWKAPGGGQGEKCPPEWVERLPLKLQRTLVAGYVAADGDSTSPVEIRVSSIWLPSLLMLRRIQARLGIAVSVRKGPGPRWETFPDGRRSWSKQKYDARWSCRNERYATTRTQVCDGMLWSKVRDVSNVDGAKFAPIRTVGSTYITAFGMSHNCDDIEPGESNYSPAAKEKRLTTLLDDVIPMGDRNTVVSLCGTTTMHGSIIHDAVRHGNGTKPAQWIIDEEFRVHYFAPIVQRPDGSRASMWPAMWSLDYLEAREGSRRYAKNYLNDPSAVGDGSYWTRALFVRREVPTTHRVLSVDPAVSTSEGSDFTAIAVVGEQAGGRGWSVDFARQFKVSPAKRREVVHRLCRQNPDIREVIVEKNQGGDTWREIFEPLPGGARLTLISVHGSKASRLDRLLDRYERGRVVHACPLPELEDQAIAYPSPAAHDDLLDATENAITHMTGGTAAGR